jgi:pimeloyl-ACP methyl ester carboxylesterase
VINAEGILKKIKTRTLVIVSDSDNLLPSAEEGPRLMKEMPNCMTETIEDVPHAALQDVSVDLPDIMKRHGQGLTLVHFSAQA